MPPDPFARHAVTGRVSRRKDLLDDAHRPLTLGEYHQSLLRCEEILRSEGKPWEILDPKGASYIKAISRRRELLLDHTSWSELDQESLRRLTGSRYRQDLQFWGLLGRMTRSNRQAVLQNEMEIRAVLDAVLQAHDHEFPEIAEKGMRRLEKIKGVGVATATLMLALARPDRLLPLASTSRKALGALSRMKHSTLEKPENYRELLRWLYDQPWYEDGPPADGDEALVRIYRFRAALVDSFVYNAT